MQTLYPHVMNFVISGKCKKSTTNLPTANHKPEYAVKAQTSLAPLSWFHGSRVTTAHMCTNVVYSELCEDCAVANDMTMKLTMREPTFMGSMTMDHVMMACDVWL